MGDQGKEEARTVHYAPRYGTGLHEEEVDRRLPHDPENCGLRECRPTADEDCG